MNKQRGAALLVALLILVAISLLGISAMKTSMFSSKVSTGVQADAMVFEAAESAIVEAYTELEEMDSVNLSSFLGGDVMSRCLAAGNPRKEGGCAGVDFMGSRGMIKASSTSQVNGFQLISGAQISSSGNAGTFVDYQVQIAGNSEMAAFNIGDSHVQELLKRGIRPSAEIE
ncbi:MAG: hypothetical protein CL537_05790 [Alcanivoracaceae bacterium]|nr:hypothetical protein [Alcanivoracaceae bacterium]